MSASYWASEQAESLRHHLNESNTNGPNETPATGDATRGTGEDRPPDDEGMEFAWKRPLEEAASANSQEVDHGAQQQGAGA